MKKYIFCISILSILFCTSCKKYEIINSKPGTPISPVTNLAYAITNNNVNLTWNLPSTLPDDIIKPVSVLIEISKDGVSMDPVTLENEPTSYTYSSYDSSSKYSFTVKIVGNVNTTNINVSNLRYSLGETVFP
jgi:hypothetical protein